jgi:cation transport ATPase
MLLQRSAGLDTVSVAMVVSSLTVLGNSLRLQRFQGEKALPAR